MLCKEWKTVPFPSQLLEVSRRNSVKVLQSSYSFVLQMSQSACMCVHLFAEFGRSPSFEPNILNLTDLTLDLHDIEHSTCMATMLVIHLAETLVLMAERTEGGLQERIQGRRETSLADRATLVDHPK